MSEAAIQAPPPNTQSIFKAAFSRDFGRAAEVWLLPYLAGWATPQSAERKSKYDYAGARVSGASIDYDRGLFIIEWEPTGDDLGFVFSPMSLTPDESDGRYWSDWNAAKVLLPEESFSALRVGVEIVWSRLRNRLLMEIEEGEFPIYARVGSPLASTFTRIPIDTWLAFSVVDWRRGIAQCNETGERLFGVCVQRGAGVPLPAGRDLRDVANAIQFENANRLASGKLPMSIDETKAWGKARGLARDTCREARRLLPESEKRGPGRGLAK